MSSNKVSIKHYCDALDSIIQLSISRSIGSGLTLPVSQSITMRFTSLVAFLPALALAQEQVPLADRVQGWFNKAKQYVPTAVPADPMVKMAEKVSEKRVTPVTLQNAQSILTPASEAQDWLVFVTGGNKTCFGRCEHAEKAFNVRRDPVSRQPHPASHRRNLGIRPPLLR